MNAAMSRTRRRRFGFVLLVFALVLIAIASIAIGTAGLPLATVVDILLGGGDAVQRAIVFDLRMPRVILAVLAGGALAISGTTFQAMLRNPLAEPYILGVAGGAAVCAVAVMVLSGSAAPAWTLPAAALTGAIGAILLVLRIATRVGRALDSRVLLLAGVIAGAFFNSIILLLLTFADIESFRSAMFWMMGSLATGSWAGVVLLAAYSIPAVLLLFALARPLNLLSTGEETALFLGVPVKRVKLIAYLVASMLVASSVAAVGVIGFVGLVIPHTLRLMWGSDHRFLLPASWVAGAGFLVLADTLARTIAPPTELPVGVITALIGVPVFVVLLRRSIA